MRTAGRGAGLAVGLIIGLSVVTFIVGGVEVASAQLAPSNSQIQFNVVTTTTTTTTVPATTTTVPATTTTTLAVHAAQSSLPLTGGPVLQMALSALALTVLGVILVTVGRSRGRSRRRA
jgi:hypothetical protein